ncbi:anthrone oxygenase family protein [Nonomuraea muscovyensis]|uniref:Putative membrane protein n=1 Tax=Nonomuraea muscovyensis TaxID=1124761 RepID=A0A7X0EVF3_9ACTN|nr:anthrone oxygenase family protein [Nonomuraea muscovyensis]MBB6345468.1 putative membrane protein [Nonomuraea muscovyensis]
MLPVLSILAMLLNGLMAGLFLGFSVAVIWGLDAAGPAQATAAMRGINIKILNPWFLSSFMLAPIVSLATGVLMLMGDGDTAAGVAFVAAAVVYFLGTFLSTAAVNVPLNNALEAGEVDWAGYFPRWLRWNHLRSLACTVALVLSGVGLLLS